PASVVDHAGQARGAEHLGVVVEMHLLGRREPVGHDDARHLAGRGVRAVEPAAQGRALSAELDVLAHALLLLDALPAMLGALPWRFQGSSSVCPAALLRLAQCDTPTGARGAGASAARAGRARCGAPRIEYT